MLRNCTVSQSSIQKTRFAEVSGSCISPADFAVFYHAVILTNSLKHTP